MSTFWVVILHLIDAIIPSAVVATVGWILHGRVQRIEIVLNGHLKDNPISDSD